jgi:hypothetical protein
MLALLSLIACGDSFESGASEAFRVRDGVFKTGELPSGDGETPAILYASSAGFVLSQGQGSIRYGGLASTDAYSVGVAFEDVSDGYWVVPVGAADVTQDNNLLFGLTADFTDEVPYGLGTLAFVAFDGQGRPGPTYRSSLCVLPDYADQNFLACDPTIPPQDTILSLSWDTQVDLDLVVVAPNGKVVSPKAPTTALPNEEGEIDSTTLGDPSTGELTRDSNGNCATDGLRLESLVFVGEPAPGEYEIYADLYGACGEQSVAFELALFEAVEGPKDPDSGNPTWTTERTDLARGILLASQADAGASLGAHVTTVTFPTTE